MCYQFIFRRHRKVSIFLLFFAIVSIIKHYRFVEQGDLEVSSTQILNQCIPLTENQADIDTVAEYSKFTFKYETASNDIQWTKHEEEQYKRKNTNDDTFPLKVIIVPHSHNDPGWLKTFSEYYEENTKRIIDNVVRKLTEYKDMTFIWTEICFLQMWWDQTNPEMRGMLRKLVDEKRFEITTGGWVMTDEANVHLFAMLDQLIEGHQWLKSTLNVTPTVGWSIDPFGHGSTIPYLLSSSGFKATIIQRIHYNWKTFFITLKNGDFLWKPYWTKSEFNSHSNERAILTHTNPWDSYGTPYSCGPDTRVCNKFDFKVRSDGSYDDDDDDENFSLVNIDENAIEILDQYRKTASLFWHNIALIPLGDDFRYKYIKDMDVQYTNYKKIINYVNQNPKKFANASISFGTPSDYFNAIKKRTKIFFTLKGDFFPYADTFQDRNGAYWTGFYTTRPFYKMMGRELEHNLRSAEILFTIGWNKARQNNREGLMNLFVLNYDKLIEARRNLGLFQHHDAITGTSRDPVMEDYGRKLFESIQSTENLQKIAIETLIQPSNGEVDNFLVSDLKREKFSKLSEKISINVTSGKDFKVVLYNSLAQERVEVVMLRVTSPHVKVLDPNKNKVPHQINPVFAPVSSKQRLSIVVSDKIFELQILVKLPPLSLTTYTLSYSYSEKRRFAEIHCEDCKSSSKLKHKNKQPFTIKKLKLDDLQLKNQKMKLLFNKKTHRLKSIFKSDWKRLVNVSINFGTYRSAKLRSGAYLFRPAKNGENSSFLQHKKVFVVKGPLTSYVTVVYDTLLSHTVKIFNTDSYLDDNMFLQNEVDLADKDGEIFMRFETNIKNGEVPKLYSDLNGFQWQPRTKAHYTIQGNYYPITTAAFIQDNETRLNLITTHAKGAASFKTGKLEVMLDRRMLDDDGRGLGGGVTDNRLTKQQFLLSLEIFDKISLDSNLYQLPSQQTNHLINTLNYPVNIFHVKKSAETMKWIEDVQLLNYKLPCDLHILNLRALTNKKYPLVPSESALLIVHRQGYDCQINMKVPFCTNQNNKFSDKSLFKNAEISKVQRTSLTGLHLVGKARKSVNFSLDPMEIATFNIKF